MNNLGKGKNNSIIICALIIIISLFPELIKNYLWHKSIPVDNQNITSQTSLRFSNTPIDCLTNIFLKDINMMDTATFYANNIESEINDIQDELIARKPSRLLINLYNSTKIEISRQYIFDTMYLIDDSLILNFMKTRINDSANYGNYYACMYLGKKGYTKALEILNDNYWKWPISSWQFSYTAELFGKYKYYPAIDNLIESINAASINIAAGAIEALQNLFPGSPKDFGCPEEAAKYFKNRKKNFNH
jgi:hypothetical protein